MVVRLLNPICIPFLCVLCLSTVDSRAFQGLEMGNRQYRMVESLETMQSGKYDDKTTIRMIQKSINMPLSRNIFVPDKGMIYLMKPFGNRYTEVVCDHQCLDYLATIWDEHILEYLTVSMITKKQAKTLYSICGKKAKRLRLHFAYKCKLSDILVSLTLMDFDGKKIELVNVVKDCETKWEVS